MKQTIFNLLQTSTGQALCDSGGAYGRNWERNKKKTLKDFENEPRVGFDIPETDNGLVYSKDVSFTVSLFHYLSDSLMLNETCNDFNALPCDNWDSDVYGISEKQKTWLTDHGAEIGDAWNSYNDESSLSQVIQGANVKINDDNYILLQIHQGRDVRGGYTDAKLFKLNTEYFDTNPTIYANAKDKDGNDVQLDTGYNGYSLTDEQGNNVLIKADSLEGECIIN